MFSFKAINKSKSSYKGCCLCLSKGFSTLVKTSFANLIASVIPSASKSLIMKSFCFLRSLCMSIIHLAWRGFKSLNLRILLRHQARSRLTIVCSIYQHTMCWTCLKWIFCCFIYAYIQSLKLIGKIVRNDNQFTIILCT